MLLSLVTLPADVLAVKQFHLSILFSVLVMTVTDSSWRPLKTDNTLQPNICLQFSTIRCGPPL